MKYEKLLQTKPKNEITYSDLLELEEWKVKRDAYRLQKSRFSTLTLWLFCDGAICNSGHQRRFGTRCTGRTDIDFVLSEKTCVLT